MIGSRIPEDQTTRKPRRRRHARRGSVMGLMAVLLPVLAILAAFCVNAAQMQLTRTELMVATDAAARAGGRAFSEIQTVSAAKTAAVTTAAMNTVNGEPLQLQSQDSAGEIEFGKTTQPERNGRYYFEKLPTADVASGAAIASAIRIRGRRESGSLSGRVPLVIPGLLKANDFATVQSSVAMQVDRDISLVLDRSGSMSWVTFDWPRGKSPWYTSTKEAGVAAGYLRHNSWGGYSYTSGNNSTSYQQWAWEDYYGLGPAPTSPWQDLLAAVDAFLDVLDSTVQEEQVSVASYASSATLDCWLEKDMQVIRDTVNGLNTGGSTAIGEGMDEAIRALLDSAARPYAAKTMVVMTDGIHNRGRSPKDVARDLVQSYNLTIHTVTFGGGADQDLMRDVAEIGGGNHYHAANASQLVDIFEEIANNLPTILTQ